MGRQGGEEGREGKVAAMIDPAILHSETYERQAGKNMPRIINAQDSLHSQ